MKSMEILKRIERIDQLIRLKATGSPKELASRLGISESACYDLLKAMKEELDAPIRYCGIRRTYIYEQEVRFFYGYQSINAKEIYGGFNQLLRNFWSEYNYL